MSPATTLWTMNVYVDDILAITMAGMWSYCTCDHWLVREFYSSLLSEYNNPDQVSS